MNHSAQLLFILIAAIAFSCSDAHNSESLEENPSANSEGNTDKSEESALTPLEIGQGIAMSTQVVLGRNLMKAINEKGTEHAISFCSNRAIPLTDSMSLALNASIKRVTDKTRNPINQANESEMAYIKATKRTLSEKKEAKPQLTTIDGKHVGYYPILTNQMCMQCHGQPKTEVLPKTMTRLKSVYPNDYATGYGINELRGIWVVEMGEE